MKKPALFELTSLIRLCRVNQQWKGWHRYSDIIPSLAKEFEIHPWSMDHISIQSLLIMRGWLYETPVPRLQPQKEWAEEDTPMVYTSWNFPENTKYVTIPTNFALNNDLMEYHKPNFTSYVQKYFSDKGIQWLKKDLIAYKVQKHKEQHDYLQRLKGVYGKKLRLRG